MACHISLLNHPTQITLIHNCIVNYAVLVLFKIVLLEISLLTTLFTIHSNWFIKKNLLTITVTIAQLSLCN